MNEYKTMDELKNDIASAIKEAVGFNDEITENVTCLIIPNLQKKWIEKKFYITEENQKLELKL